MVCLNALTSRTIGSIWTNIFVLDSLFIEEDYIIGYFIKLIVSLYPIRFCVVLSLYEFWEILVYSSP